MTATPPSPPRRGTPPTGLRLYPAVPSRRATTVGLDVVVALLVALFAWFAITVHSSVSDMAGLAGGVASAGASAQEALEAAARQVGEVPLVGGTLAQALRDAGTQTGADAAAIGRSGRRDIEATADALGWAFFLIPTLLLLLGYLPNRWAQVQRLTAAARILGDGGAAADHPRLVAMRAVFGLPYQSLLRHTPDPLGDLERGEYDALVAAVYDEAGLLRR